MSKVSLKIPKQQLIAATGKKKRKQTFLSRKKGKMTKKIKVKTWITWYDIFTQGKTDFYDAE